MAAMSSEPAAPTPAAPTLSRRHAAGSASARGLLFTVLGEFVLPAGGAVWTSAFIDVLGRLGVEEKATRQALMRTAADGWLDSQRIGRRTTWSLTPAADKLLTEGRERIYGFSGVGDPWDGRWLLVLARSPEAERQNRHLLRTRLTWAGLGSPAPGVWISPHAGRIAEVERALAEAGVLGGAQVFVGEHQGGPGRGELAALVGQAWDLGAIERGYEGFLERFRSAGTRDPLATTIELVHAWRRFPWVDPALPKHLLPTPWSGTAAADLFGTLHRCLVEHAQGQWRELNETAG